MADGRRQHSKKLPAALFLVHGSGAGMKERQMVLDERLYTYIDSLDAGEGEFLEQLRADAEKRGVPIIRRQAQKLLAVLLEMKRPEKILEVGTAIGYSSLFMAQVLPGTIITTIELSEERAGEARRHIREAGKERQIHVLCGDSAKLLPELSGQGKTYDFLFLDAAKGQYIRLLPVLKQLLVSGGVLVTDNVLQDGTIIDSRFLIERRDRTIHERVRDYNWAVMHDNELTSCLLATGDGMTVSVKKDER